MSVHDTHKCGVEWKVRNLHNMNVHKPTMDLCCGASANLMDLTNLLVILNQH